MRVILGTENSLTAKSLRNYIVESIKGEKKDIKIDTWSYEESDGFDIIYHNAAQYINDQEKNVLFIIKVDGANVVFTSARWTKNVEPTTDMISIHIGRLTEMLLRYFRHRYNRFDIDNFKQD